MMLKIFVGWDPRETEAFDVFRRSLITRASKPIEIIPLKQQELRDQGLFSRPRSEKAATEFSMTRWLVPYLSGYEGVSIFADCDMLCLTDIYGVLDGCCAEPGEERTENGLYFGYPISPAVWCCQHDYVPKNTTKMDGQVQTVYPKKNWSSFMVFNNAHEKCRDLTPELISRPDHPPKYFHQFQWLDTLKPGSLDLRWNHLAGEYEVIPDPKIVHFTEGGPWFQGYEHCDYSELWDAERAAMRGSMAGCA